MTSHLKGVGWTETAISTPIYSLIYDNAYLGYPCGFNSGVDVAIYPPSAGEPGWHLIDGLPSRPRGRPPTWPPARQRPPRLQDESPVPPASPK